MLYGALDIGSNSVRLLLGEVHGGRIRPRFFDLKSSRLMGGFQGGYLSAAAMERTVEAVKELYERTREYPIRNFLAVATSAAREALNAGVLLSRIRDEVGLTVKVIDGEEEARLTFRGVRAGLQDMNEENLLVVDVGGGSTELAWEEGTALRLRSLPLGAVRCTERGISKAEIKGILAPVLEELRGCPAAGSRSQASAPRPSPRIWQVVGTGGTATTLAALELGLAAYRPELVHGLSLTCERVRYWLELLSRIPEEDRRKLPGLQPQRADIIVAGVAILAAVLEGLEAEELIVSEADLLWGLLLEAAGEE